MRCSESSSVAQQAGGQPETCSTLSQRRGSEREKKGRRDEKMVRKKNQTGHEETFTKESTEGK